MPVTFVFALSVLPVLYVAVATPFLVVFDVRHRRLPNVIVLPGLAVVALAAAAAALVAHVDASGTALVAGVTLVVFALFRAAGALAMGDVKLAVLLAAALAPLAGASLAPYVLAVTTTAFTAGLVSLLVLDRTRRRSRRSCDRACRCRERTTRACGRACRSPRQAAGGLAFSPREQGSVRVGVRPPVGVASTVRASPSDIPLGPFLLLGFWVPVVAAIVLPGGVIPE
ncbi:hypothetical protein B7R54_11505 [Subtercola boreus]|uniref:Prepilin type IV endopeptidase peptidase domain-containing protein n=1 Tax=Subtercola boreus TaxID=120213 RepID=A0A3E0VII2_9MICO|nr:prepilin peptidase [Subtercola boreus]RFA09762.1 hypothetical protein B7R54_11505 [Subtercola boreus]TQL53127.1 Flp pilus assembly protein protease CpaA [Subtercola boreus]